MHKRQTPDADNDYELLLREVTEGRERIDLTKTQEYVQWINNDIHRSVADRLHRGKYAVQDFIDLHGCTREEAEVEMDRFLKNAIRKGLHCIKIIHGRGLRSVQGPVLKEAVCKRLRGKYRKHTAAFVTARQCDGGLGAVYVLLLTR